MERILADPHPPLPNVLVFSLRRSGPLIQVDINTITCVDWRPRSELEEPAVVAWQYVCELLMGVLVVRLLRHRSCWRGPYKSVSEGGVAGVVGCGGELPIGDPQVGCRRSPATPSEPAAHRSDDL